MHKNYKITQNVTHVVMILKERGNESSYGCYRIAMITSVCDCILFGAVQNQKNILVPCGYDITPDGYR